MLDYKYLCQKISDMAGLPIRVFENYELVYFYCFVPLYRDPANSFYDDFLRRKKHIDYYVSENADYYGILNSKNLTIVIGPSLNPLTDEQQLKKIAFDLQVPLEDTESYIRALKTLVRMPLNSILQILCTLNYVFNDEKSNISDVEENRDTSLYFPENENSQSDIYRSLHVENTLCSFIEKGDLNGFDAWIKEAPTVKEGKMSDDSLRQKKNIFIVSITLFSRTAIKAGMDPEEALKISDSYIQRCENCYTPSEVMNLQVKMIRQYIEAVASFKKISADGYLARRIFTIVKKNISDSISTEWIAEQLGYSRSHLSTQFKKESGLDLKDFILKIKMEEAEKLLKETDNSLSSIALYLGYSSPAHFSSAFHKYTGINPSAYRKNRKKEEMR